MQSHNYRLDFCPSSLSSSLTLSNFTRANGDLVTDFEASLKDSTTSDATLESLGVLTWLVDVKGTNNNHVRGHSELSRWDWNTANIINNNIDVVLENSRDWNNGDGGAGSGGKRLLDFVLLLGDSNLVLDDQIDLVLKDNDVLEAHNINSD